MFSYTPIGLLDNEKPISVPVRLKIISSISKMPIVIQYWIDSTNKTVVKVKIKNLVELTDWPSTTGNKRPQGIKSTIFPMIFLNTIYQ